MRSILSWLAPTRAYAGAFVATALVGLASCFLPLVDLVGYESAAVFGGVGGIAAMLLTLHAIDRRVVAGPLDAERIESPGADFFVLLARHQALLVAPLVFLSLNALRVVNCAYGVGLAFWLTIPAASIVVGQMSGWLAAAIFPGNMRRQLVFCAAAVLVSAALPLAHLALEPSIVGHQLFLGYFSGSIYDEALSLPASLAWYRVMHLIGAAALLAVLEARFRYERRRPARWLVVAAVIAALGAALIWWHRQDLGIAIDRAYIEETLDGRLETEHFVIHYPRTRGFLKQHDKLAEDHEFRYAEMAAFFDTDPADSRKIHSYVYPDRETKGRLMGGRRTMVAKLWLHEMHIMWGHYGEHTLAHELAHIFTEPFGAGPLDLSMQSGIGVNMGLVEGAATAADWPTEELSPHQASAALRRLEIAPDIRSIVAASGFWTQSSGLAYTLVGSFVRYLIDEYGIEAFKRVYPSGDFRAGYDKSASELVSDWEAYVDGIELAEHEMELARYLYERPTIFDKVCARQIGELRRRAQLAAQSGRVGRVGELYEQILGFAPDNINYRISYAHALSSAGDDERASEMVGRLLDEEQAPSLRAELLHLRGDLAWRQQQLEPARAAYRECEQLGVPGDTRRLLEVKLEALSRPSEHSRMLAFEYLLGQHPATVSLYFPMRWHHQDQQDAVAAYLVGRRLWNAHQYERALGYLEQAARELDDSAIADEAVRMLATSHFFAGRLDEAVGEFERLSTSELVFYREQSREWLDRIAWRRGNRIGTQ